MPHYRVHRIKDTPREHFRWAAHTGGLAIVKPKDYEPGEELDAQNPYETWKRLAAEGHPLHPGDLLEVVVDEPPPGGLWIAKYIGFEPAQWFVPAPPTQPEQAGDGAMVENAPPLADAPAGA